MKDLLMIAGTIIIVIAIGVALYFFGPTSFRSFLPHSAPPTTSFRLLKEGQNATSMTDRVNYQITDGTQLNQLWGYVDTTPNATPNLDFTQSEVLAIFDGTHTTGGYRIAVSSITTENNQLVVHVTRYTPGKNCITTPVITSPYQIIAIPKSSLPLTHIDTTAVADCSS